ncbi:MAG: thiamine pyrophosphate-binding protein, partial [Dehalococcoidia bacterium]
MPEMTGGQALVRSLHREGVRVIFGLPGVQLYHFLDALYDEPEIRFITTRHEQATTYMADGYARASGTVGTALVVPGPGLQNASAGLGNAYAASSPVLLISGQINRDNIGRDIGILHEVNDQLEIVRPVTKWRARALEVREIPGLVQDAFCQLRTGRPRPVEIEIPPEALAEVADVEVYEPGKFPADPGDPREIEKAVGLLVKAQSPVIWAGGGVLASGAWQELQDVAEYLQAPIITTPEGKGAVSDRHHLSLGVTRGRSTGQVRDWLRKYFESCDVALAVGTRFATAEPPETQNVIQIDVDEEELGRNHADTVGILGDAKLVLHQLLDGLKSAAPSRPSREAELEAMRSQRYDPSK